MKITKDEFLNYYELGLKDSEISRLSGDSESTINVLRKKLNLPPNGRKVISDEEFLDLYYKGKTDTEISNITGCSEAQSRRRRTKYNLEKNIKQTVLTQCFLELYNSGHNDIEISKITGFSKSRVQAYRSSLGFPPVEKTSINLEEVKKLVESKKSDKEIGELLNYSEGYIKFCRIKLLNIKSERNKPNSYKYEGDELQVLLGSLLGDGTLQKHHKNGGTVLKISHCLKQKEYIEYKQNILKNNCSDVKLYSYYDKRRKNPEYSQYSIYTFSSLDLNNYYYNWYKPNKQIYKEDLYKIEALGLAIWYMDDGYKCKPYGGCMLCTNCFTRDELKIIQQMFKEKFNIEVTINCESSNLVYIPSKEFPKFKTLIEPYIVPCMKYKIE